MQFDAIHLISHGGTGWIGLNAQVIRLDALDQEAALWQSVKTSLNETGDLLLYACEVTQDTHGQVLLTQLAQFTGADVAASSNVTGVAGDWILETTSGSIETLTMAPLEWQGNLWANGRSPATNALGHATYGVWQGGWFGDPYSAPQNIPTYETVNRDKLIWL